MITIEDYLISVSKINKKMSLKESISNIVIDYIQQKYGNNLNYANQILLGVKRILTDKDYNFPKKLSFGKVSKNIIIQNALSKLNEKESRRKKEGVYYTDSDVTNFICVNVMLHYIESRTKDIKGFETCIDILSKKSKDKLNKIFNATIFDPTCGAGEFLLSALSIKMELCKKIQNYNALDLVRNIYGNDIETQSTDIAKIRIFFYVIDNSDDLADIDGVVSIINHNFTNIDMVNTKDNVIWNNKDIILGNPPYVEYRNFDGKHKHNYGNVYADVLHNSVDMMSEKGIMAFVVPLSYVSTIRMKGIRDYISKNAEKQIVLNFADRPDALFSCVHQKLTIVLAQKKSTYKGVLSSSYKYWYKAERKSLFNNISVIETDTGNDEYLPKIGNKTELDIYKKFQERKGKCIYELKSEKGTNKTIYINQRGCFWMKVFSKEMNSKSYMEISIAEEYQPFVYCLINSSLFFLLWIIISDGWHITKKELSFIKIPSNINNYDVWIHLMNRLENRLEDTKVYVGTKQVDYEYKHKKCKYIIDDIDEELSKVFNLDSSQLDYIKSFGLKYRLGDGA